MLMAREIHTAGGNVSQQLTKVDIPIDPLPERSSSLTKGVTEAACKSTEFSVRETKKDETDKCDHDVSEPEQTQEKPEEDKAGSVRKKIKSKPWKPTRDPGKYTVSAQPPRRVQNMEAIRRMSRGLDRALGSTAPGTGGSRSSAITRRRAGSHNQPLGARPMRGVFIEEEVVELPFSRSTATAREAELLSGPLTGSVSSLVETPRDEAFREERRRALLGPAVSGSLQSLPDLGKKAESGPARSSGRTVSKQRQSRSAQIKRDAATRSFSTRDLSARSVPPEHTAWKSLFDEQSAAEHLPVLPRIQDPGESPQLVGIIRNRSTRHPAQTDLTTFLPGKSVEDEEDGSLATSRRVSTQSSSTAISISSEGESSSAQPGPDECEDGFSGKQATEGESKTHGRESIHSWLSWPQTSKGRAKYAERDQPPCLTTPTKRYTSAPQKRILLKRSIVITDEAAYWRQLKIEEKISIDTLESLKQAFQAADVDGTGKLELDEFKDLLKNHLNLAASKEGQIDALFQKIDWSSEGAITWDEFCTYMQLEYAEKEDSYLRAKDVAFTLPAKIESMPHREPVLRVTDTHDGIFIACSQDGLVTFWSGQLEHKRTRTVVTAEQSSRTKAKWITDFCLMPQYNKLIVGTGDREIQFFELSSFEPYCQISGLETVPLKLDYCSTGHDECLILFGDSQGCVNIIVIGSAGECLRMWKKAPKAEGIASVSIDVVAKSPSTEYIRWKVHGDWVQQLKYYHNIRQVISCSNHAKTALVIGGTMGSTHVEQQLKEIKEPGQPTAATKMKQAYQFGQPKTRLDADQAVFKVYKGVKCFDFSKHKNIIITGGMDRIVRIWNPYVPGKPTGMLRGHSAPIFYLFIAEEENRIFSISTDLCIKIWDIQDQNCLLTVRPKGHKIRGDLQACHYSSVSKALAVATDQMNGLTLKLKPSLHADIVITHKDPIHACIFNPGFKQIITASDGSVIKIWDFETGNMIFEYGEAHGEHAITCMTFDNTGRRLITGGRDGCIRIWNYNNGHCLKTMKKEKDNEEVCSITYVEMNKNRYIVAVGWDKRINIYSDAADGGVHHIQHPLPKWSDDLNNGHREDILSVAQCPPNLLATSSYDGEVIVWNMVSGHIFCHLKAPAPEGYTDQSLDGDLSINKLTFLKTRAYNKEAATLVSSGPRGHIHFWNVFSGGAMLAQFPGSKMPGAMVSTLEVTKTDTMLMSADSLGFVYVWNISGYCLSGLEKESPELLYTWRGHVESVTCMTLIEDTRTLLTASVDCTVRVWSFEGEYVGTFGQPDTWDIYNSGSYQHPMVPYDVLIDPMSLPDHPVLQEKQNTHQVIHEDSARNSDTEDDKQAERRTPTQYGRQQIYVGDEEIAEEVKKLAPSLRSKEMKNKGKRLRHEQKKPIKVDRGGPSEYHMLTCYSLEPTPAPAEPKFKTDKDNQFDFFPAE